MRILLVLSAALGLAGAQASAETPGIEKPEVTLGFVRLVDMAPLAVAAELGFFADEGLEVTLKAQGDWQILLDKVIDGKLDGAQMLAAQPLAAAGGYGTQARIVVPFSLGLDGSGITVSNAVWERIQSGIPQPDDRPVSAEALRAAVEDRAGGAPFRMGVASANAPDAYMLRYWLAAGGLAPGFYSPDDATGGLGAEVLVSVAPPARMVEALAAGELDGYSAGEPWNQMAAFQDLGVPVAAGPDVRAGSPNTVFGLTEEFAQANPNTVLALTKALIRAAQWLDADAGVNRAEAAAILALKAYVDADAEVIARSMLGALASGRGGERTLPEIHRFFRDGASFPFYSDAVWLLTQMRRWGQIPEPKPDAWYDETARAVYKPGIYLEAARGLVDESLASEADFLWDSDGYKPATDAFADQVEYDGRAPNAYLDQFAIGLKGSGSAAQPGG